MMYAMILSTSGISGDFAAGALSVILMCMLAWSFPIVIITLIVKFARRKNTNDERYMHDRIKNQREALKQTAYKKIVACSSCGKQMQFGNGTCKYCGAPLLMPQRKPK